MYIAVVGNISDGFTLYGPFEELDHLAQDFDLGNECQAVKLQPHISVPWNNPLVQFARLISEAEAVGAFSAHWDHLKDEMDLETGELALLIDRALTFWDEFLHVETQLDED